MNQENIKNQKEFQYCNIHQHYKADLLYISRENQVFEEICFVCLQQNFEKYNIQDIIPINEFIHSKHDTIINHFPPLSNDKILNSLQNSSQLQKDLEDKIKQIRDYFEKLKETIQNSIKKLEMKVNHKIEHLKQMKIALIETYNKLSSKEQIKGIYQANPSNLMVKMNEILKDKFKNIEQNTQTLCDQVKKVQTMYGYLDFEQPNQLQQDLVYLIENIDFFPKVNQKQSEESMIEQLRGKKNQNQEDSYVETLIQLISNQTNYCTNEFITHIKQELMRNKFILNRNKFNNQIHDKMKSLSFKNLQQNQLEDIRLLCNKILVLDKNKSKLSRVSNYLAVPLKKDNFIPDCPFKVLLKKYPIFELESTSQIYDSNFYKSQYQSSHVSILKSIRGIEIIPLNSSQTSLVYSDILQQDLNYIIRVQTIKISSCRFGFVTESEKDLEKPHFITLFQEQNSPLLPAPPLNQKLLVPVQPPQINGYEIQYNNKLKTCCIKRYPSQQLVNQIEILNISKYRFAIQTLEKVQIFDFYAFKDSNKNKI